MGSCETSNRRGGSPPTCTPVRGAFAARILPSRGNRHQGLHPEPNNPDEITIDEEEVKVVDALAVAPRRYR